MNEMVRVQGLSKLLRSIASRLEGDVDGLSKELLEQSAAKLDELEDIAGKAVNVIRTSGYSKVPARMVVYTEVMLSLKTALHKAGYSV